MTIWTYNLYLSKNRYFLKDGEFSGLIPLIDKFLADVDVGCDTRCRIGQYLEFISKKASGRKTLLTP